MRAGYDGFGYRQTLYYTKLFQFNFLLWLTVKRRSTAKQQEIDGNNLSIFQTDVNNFQKHHDTASNGFVARLTRHFTSSSNVNVYAMQTERLNYTNELKASTHKNAKTRTGNVLVNS